MCRRTCVLIECVMLLFNNARPGENLPVKCVRIHLRWRMYSRRKRFECANAPALECVSGRKPKTRMLVITPIECRADASRRINYSKRIIRFDAICIRLYYIVVVAGRFFPTTTTLQIVNSNGKSQLNTISIIANYLFCVNK